MKKINSPKKADNLQIYAAPVVINGLKSRRRKPFPLSDYPKKNYLQAKWNSAADLKVELK